MPFRNSFRRTVSFLAGEKNGAVFRMKHSVIRKIWKKVLIGTLFSALVVAVHRYIYTLPEIQFHSVLGMVIGLLLVFRTTTGYDRFWEGRKLWTDIISKTKGAARCIWLGVDETSSTAKHRIEKRSAINLLIAFAYATKNYLRDEYDYDEDPDLEQLIRHLPRIQQGTKMLDVPLTTRPTMRIKSGSEAPYKKRKIVKTLSKRKEAAIQKQKEDGPISMPYDYFAPTNIPMELIYYYQTYVYKVVDEKRLKDAETGKILLNASNDLMNCLTQLERIRRTPIPLAYSIHLHQAIFLYLASVPFQLVWKMGWATVAAQALICFAFLGILAIGWEIENPFGYDDNDLPLDDYCNVLRQEIERFVRDPFPDPDVWVLSPENRPFGPDCYRPATDLNLLSGQELQEAILKDGGRVTVTVSVSDEKEGVQNGSFEVAE